MTMALAAFAGMAMVASANDRVIVEFPFNVTAGDKVLEPGKYTIQRLPNSTSKVLLIHDEDGKFQAMMMPISAYSLRTPEDTKVVLHRVGDHEYHFDKIWIQGNNYGYEIPLSKKVKSRQAEWLLAKSVPRPAVSEELAVDSEASRFADVAEAAQALVPDLSTDVDTPAATAAATETEAEPETLAYATPPAAFDSANSVAEPIEMPETAANWLSMLLLGAAIPTAGLWALRRRA
jgi:hypothetical protein